MNNLSFNLLRKLLVKDSKPLNYGVFCLLGYLLSFLILTISYQAYRDIHRFNVESSENDKKYIILNRAINWMDTLKLRSNGFSEDDINRLKKLEFIQNTAPFTSNQFQASLSIGGSYFPRYAVDLFFESIESSMIDLNEKLDNWDWKKEDDFVPVLIPHTFFALYNFGFAPSRGLPTLSEEMAGKLNLNIQISDGSRSIIKIGRIIGFSKRINSVLVPESFMNWANKEYGTNNSNNSPTRLMVEFDASKEELLQQYLKENNLQSNTEELLQSSYLKWAHFAILGFQALGIFIAILALLLNMLIVRIIIAAARRNINSLHLLGYKSKRIFNFYWILQISVQILAIILLLPIGYVFRSYWLKYYETISLDHYFGYDWLSLLPVLALTMVGQIIVYTSIKKQLNTF